MIILFDGYFASSGKYSSLLSDTVNDLVGTCTQAHVRIHMCMSGSAKEMYMYAAAQFACANC